MTSPVGIDGLLQILMGGSVAENARSKLYQTLLDVFPAETLCFLSRSAYNETDGMETIRRLAMPKLLDGILFGCMKKYYAFLAVSALFSFVERDVGVVLTPHTLMFSVKPGDGALSLGT